MNFLSKSVLLFVACLLANIQVSAQCSNINSQNSSNAPNTQIFGGQVIGQSIHGTCFTGNLITKLAFWSHGNSLARVNLHIYESDVQTVSGTPIYTQEAIAVPPGNFGTKSIIELAQAVPVQSDKMYTFTLTNTGGNFIAPVSDNKYTGGQLYLAKDGNAGFRANHDLRFEVETIKRVLECAGAATNISVKKISGNTIEILVEKTGINNFTIFPPNNNSTILEFENVTHSLTRSDGVGPQAGASSQVWVVTRTDPSKPAKIKYIGNHCGGGSLTLLE